MIREAEKKSEGKGLKHYYVRIAGRAVEEGNMSSITATRHSERNGTETLTSDGWQREFPMTIVPEFPVTMVDTPAGKNSTKKIKRE